MTDDTGIIQHASYSVPARSTGYCVDDNARALIVAVQADRIHGGADTRALVTRYLSYLHGSQQPGRQFPELHELRARAGREPRIRRLHRARDLGARRHCGARSERRLPPARSRHACARTTLLARARTARNRAGCARTRESARGRTGQGRRAPDARRLGREAVRCLPRQRIGRLALVRIHADLRQRDACRSPSSPRTP